MRLDPSPHRPRRGLTIFHMTEMTTKPVPRTPVAIQWAEDDGFEVPIEAQSAPGFPIALTPPLTPNDTGFLSAPPAPF